MGIKRIPRYTTPPLKADTEQLRKYIVQLVKELQVEAFTRVRDFEGFIFDTGTITTLTTDTLTVNTALALGDKQVNTNVKARAYLSADQENLSDNTWTKINLNTESYDIGADFDHATNYKFTTPVAGYYLVSGAVHFVGASVVADKHYGAAIYYDSAVKKYNVSHASLAAILSIPVVDIIYAAASKDIELYGYHNAGVDTVDVDGGSAVLTHMAVHLLSV